MILAEKQTQIKSALDNLYACRSTRYLQNDPLSFCHRYADSQDQEIVGLIASSFAYGKVHSIKKSVEEILAVLTPSPLQCLSSYEPASFVEAVTGFKHRFNNHLDLMALLWAIKTMIESSRFYRGLFPALS